MSTKRRASRRKPDRKDVARYDHKTKKRRVKGRDCFSQCPEELIHIIMDSMPLIGKWQLAQTSKVFYAAFQSYMRSWNERVGMCSAYRFSVLIQSVISNHVPVYKLYFNDPQWELDQHEAKHILRRAAQKYNHDVTRRLMQYIDLKPEQINVHGSEAARLAGELMVAVPSFGYELVNYWIAYNAEADPFPYGFGYGVLQHLVVHGQMGMAAHMFNGLNAYMSSNYVLPRSLLSSLAKNKRDYVLLYIAFFWPYDWKSVFQEVLHTAVANNRVRLVKNIITSTHFRERYCQNAQDCQAGMLRTFFQTGISYKSNQTVLAILEELVHMKHEKIMRRLGTEIIRATFVKDIVPCIQIACVVADDSKKYELFVEACKYNRVKVARYLVDEHGVRPIYGEWFVHVCERNYDSIVKLCLAHDTFKPHTGNNAALLAAAGNGALKCAALLLAHPKVNPCVRRYGILKAALRQHQHRVATMLLKTGKFTNEAYLYEIRGLLERHKEYGMIQVLATPVK